jgi:hypothetical protein
MHTQEVASTPHDYGQEIVGGVCCVEEPRVSASLFVKITSNEPISQLMTCLLRLPSNVSFLSYEFPEECTRGIQLTFW